MQSADPVARVGTTDYTTLSSAVAAGSLTNPVYILQDIALTSQFTLTKNVKIMSDPEASEPKKIIRTFTANNFFMLNNGVELQLENTIIDGNGDNVKDNQGTMIYINSKSKLVLKDGAVIQNAHCNKTGAGVWLSGGTLDVDGGKIINNTGIRGSAIDFNTVTGNVVYLRKGEASGNTIIPTATTVSGAVNFLNGSLYISGDMVIKDNIYISGGIETNIDIFVASGLYITQNGNFTGQAGIYMAGTGTRFGTNSDTYSGAENFYNNKDEYLIGTSLANKQIVWDPIIWTAEIEPTTKAEGLLKGIGTYNAGHEVEAVLPKLSLDDYTVQVNPANTVVTYTLKNSYYGVQSFDCGLKPISEADYTWEIVQRPTETLTGTVIFRPEEYPGVEVS